MVWPVGSHTEGNTIKRKVLRSNFLPKESACMGPHGEWKGKASAAMPILSSHKTNESSQ